MVVGLLCVIVAAVILLRSGTRPVAINVVVGEGSSIVDRSANSPTLAVSPLSPDTILLSERIDRPEFSCALYRSTDAGAHWKSIIVPLPPHYDTCYAPDVTFDRHGNAILVFLTLNTHPTDPLSAGNDPNGVWLARSKDGGQTFAPAVHVLGADKIQVRIAADPNADRLYLLWLNGTDLENHTPLGLGPPPNPLKISVSTNGGKSFSRAVQVNLPHHLRVGAPTLLVGANGTVNVLFNDFGNDLDDYNNRALPFNGTFSLLLARSHDHGRTFRESLVDDQVVRAGRFLVYLPPQPALALDRTGRNVFAAWQDGRGGAPDVVFRASHDGGVTWSAIRRMNERDAAASAAYLPALSVSDRGRLDVLFLDEHIEGSKLATDAIYRQSNDGGETFSKPLIATRQPFDAFIGPLNPRTQSIDLGTRLSLHSGDTHAYAAWPDSHLGTPDSGRQDIAFSSIDAAYAEGQALRLPGGMETAPPLRSTQMGTPNATQACVKAKPVRALFLAYESRPDELLGLRYFVSDWGNAKNCFSGRVVTDSAALRGSDYDVVVVDVSPDMMVPSTALTDIRNAMRRGKALAVFMQPADSATQRDVPRRIQELRALFPGLAMDRTCANSQFTKATGGPFDLFQRSFHYESFIHGVYDVSVAGRSFAWAVDLCKSRKPTVLRTPSGLIAGFYIAYEVSLADNNAPAVTAKRLVVNVINELGHR